MSEISSGTVLITGPTGGLGRSATMAMANRPEGERPDLLLVGRPGQALHDVGDGARAAAMLTTGELVSQLLNRGQYWMMFWAPGMSGTWAMAGKSRCAMRKSGLADSRTRTRALSPWSSTYSRIR
jgi:hypothetical protein